jgi:hypothetical protein
MKVVEGTVQAHQRYNMTMLPMKEKTALFTKYDQPQKNVYSKPHAFSQSASLAYNDLYAVASTRMTE